MIRLTVKDFSAINEATISLGRLTVIIGPQASGKSVLCKLNYFFLELLEDQVKFLGEGRSLEYFKEFIKVKFCQWFPVTAWGNRKFSISFEAGNYSIRMVRTVSKKENSGNFRLSISESFTTAYNETLQKLQNRKRKSGELTEYDYEYDYQAYRLITAAFQNILQKDFISNQIFIPAGRSFFTNIGKAVTAFEQGNILDPLTIKFGRLFTAYKHERRFRGRAKTESVSKLNDSLTRMLGGKHIEESDREYVLLTDGRKIPLSALSSGQQELLPLLTILPYFIGKETFASRKYKNIVYIEEPEAHLFPMAQSTLVEILAKIVKLSGNTLDMVITTHSPYVLAKLNNLIKAGQIARKSQGNKRRALADVIDEDGWLAKSFVEAYSICNGKLDRIIDEDGLISADYLDSVSFEIGEQFSTLLDIEFAK